MRNGERLATLVVLVRELANAAARILDHVRDENATVPFLALHPPPAEWSKLMSTGQAATLLGISEDALRSRIRRIDRERRGYAFFDGVEARRLGRNWRVRLAARWFGTDPSVARRVR